MTTFITDKSRYIHIPKTGGRFVTEVAKNLGILKLELPALDTAWGKHADPKDTYKYNKLFTFTTVRHPITWFQSTWASRMKVFRHKSWKYRDSYKDVEAHSFNEFVKNCIRKHPGHYTEIIKRFTRNVNFICYFEALRFDTVKALKMAGETCDFTQFLNTYKIYKYASDYKNFDCAYTRETLKMVIQSERYVIDKYYSFLEN